MEEPLAKKKFSKRGEKPTTYRRVVTENSKGKAVVQSDGPQESNCARTVQEPFWKKCSPQIIQIARFLNFANIVERMKSWNQ
jgi:hypothetical protein